jgi:hypothetical protein
VHNEQVAADNRMDRMAIWMRNVERMLIVWQTFHLPDIFRILQKSSRMLAKTLLHLPEK